MPLEEVPRFALLVDGRVDYAVRPDADGGVRQRGAVLIVRHALLRLQVYHLRTVGGCARRVEWELPASVTETLSNCQWRYHCIEHGQQPLLQVMPAGMLGAMTS